MNHTPQPWRLEKGIIRGEHYGIAKLVGLSPDASAIDAETAAANARLIAAAPDLLAALTECVTALQAELENRQEAGADMTEYADEIANPLEIARAALAKAGL